MSEKEYFEHLEGKVEDLYLENEIMLLKLHDAQEKLKRIKTYIMRNATYTGGHPTIDDIEGIFSSSEIKHILKIIEGEEWKFI